MRINKIESLNLLKRSLSAKLFTLGAIAPMTNNKYSPNV